MREQAEVQLEVSVSAGDEESIVVTRSCARALKAGAGFGVSKDILHERLDFGGALFCEPLVAILGLESCNFSLELSDLAHGVSSLRRCRAGKGETTSENSNILSKSHNFLCSWF